MNRLAVLFFLLCTTASAQKLAYVEEFGSKIYFEPPDTSVWILEKNEMEENGVYVLLWKHIAITDSLGRGIEPVVSIIIETVRDSSDVVTYSLLKRMDVPFTVDKVLTYEGGYYSHRNTIGYEGEYTKDNIVHKLLIAHMRQASVGIQVVCDSTDGVYEKVRDDMLNFIKQIGIDM